MVKLNLKRMIEKLEEAAVYLADLDSGTAAMFAEGVGRTLADYNARRPCGHWFSAVDAQGAYCENCLARLHQAADGRLVADVDPDAGDAHAAAQELEGNELAERLEREAEERHAGEDDDEAPTALRVVDLDRSSVGRDQGREDFHADG